MGASAREIERQIKETRDRMDENLNQLEGRAASSALRFARIAAAVVGVIVVGGVAFLIYRRMRKPTLRGRLDDLPIDELRKLSARLKDQFPSVTVRLNEKTEREPGAMESIVRRVVPALVGTASTALIERVTRVGDKANRRGGPPPAD